MKSVIIVLGLAAALAGCGSSGSKDDAPSNTQNASSPGTEYIAPDSKGIQTQTARTSAIPEYLDLPAHIEADPTRVVHVFAPAGGRIVEMKVRPWDRVEKGQTLAVAREQRPGSSGRGLSQGAGRQTGETKGARPRSGSAGAQRNLRKGFRAGPGRCATDSGGGRSCPRAGSGIRYGSRPRLDPALSEGAARGSDSRYRSGARRIFASAFRACSARNRRRHHQRLGRRRYLRTGSFRREVGSAGSGHSQRLSRPALGRPRECRFGRR